MSMHCTKYSIIIGKVSICNPNDKQQSRTRKPYKYATFWTNLFMIAFKTINNTEHKNKHCCQAPGSVKLGCFSLIFI